MTIDWEELTKDMMFQIQLEQDKKILWGLRMSKYSPRNHIEWIYILALLENHKLYDEWENGVYVVNAYERYPEDYEAFRFVFSETQSWE